MNRARVEQIANAVLYEGYLLYPYRLSSVKNQRRFNFGVLTPPAYSAVHNGSERSEMRTECLLRGGADTHLEITVRFLQVTGAEASSVKAKEREFCLQSSLAGLQAGSRHDGFSFFEGGAEIAGNVEMEARRVGEDLSRVIATVRNSTHQEKAGEFTRDEILPKSLVSAHTLLFARNGEFVSLLDPPENCSAAAAECQNLGTWPVLVGEQGECDAMLSSPIILYDYPQVAAESPGDLFDATEIDEILSLRILTLTEEEKQEVRGGDDRARRILERTELLSDEHMMKLHGVLRGLRPVEELK
jgi:hydrogenase maturation protease